MYQARPVLTAAQIDRFARDGFVVVPDLYSAEDMHTVAAWTAEISAWPEMPGRHMVYYEDSVLETGKRIVQRIENFAPYHQGFHRLFAEGRMYRAVSELFGEDAILFKDKINYKMPGGDGFKPHQDAQAGWNAYARYYITVLASIDAATLENGCLELVAGRHRNGLAGDEWRPLAEEAIQGMEFVPYPTKPGDAVFFDSYTPHRSAPNLTTEWRRVLYVTYNRASEGDHRTRYFADKRRSFPPDIEREPGKKYVFRV
jgi:2-aminoethylphosphonate dioxygenase